MKVSIFASILCFFSVTVLAAPPSSSKKMCKTQLTTPEKTIVIDSASGECHTLQMPAYPSNLKVIQPNSGIITAFSTPKCATYPIFNQQSPVQLQGPTYIASFITRC